MLAGRPNIVSVSGPTHAEIINAFMSRASRVINSELVSTTIAQLEAGYSFNARVIGPGQTEISWEAHNEHLVKSLAVDLRPFLPWVDDIVRVTRVMNAVLNSITDEDWRRTVISIKDEYQKILNNEMFSSHWSIPSEQWQMSATDLELAKLVLNSQWFHEGMDPRMRHLLDSDHQQMGNYQAVWRVLNHTVLIVTVLQRFITEADDAGVLHPRTK
ncbi:hypothetical protein MGALJ_19710 [Mycobacterium gallinarum]|uniref:Uncharacterized protein n=1 Tax=Mycobacterium gallinarum TaxID=39689 RepID=A0A9W4B1N7_9MYCO|nr:hypothetical protein MGALJ_19710 [Mycobacterium gallinarum]